MIKTIQKLTTIVIPNTMVKLPDIMTKTARYKNSFLVSQRRLKIQTKHWPQTKKVKLRTKRLSSRVGRFFLIYGTDL